MVIIAFGLLSYCVKSYQIAEVKPILAFFAFPDKVIRIIYTP